MKDLIEDTDWNAIREAKAWLIMRQWDDVTNSDIPEAILQLLDRMQDLAVESGFTQEEVYGKLE